MKSFQCHRAVVGQSLTYHPVLATAEVTDLISTPFSWPINEPRSLKDLPAHSDQWPSLLITQSPGSQHTLVVSSCTGRGKASLGSLLLSFWPLEAHGLHTPEGHFLIASCWGQQLNIRIWRLLNTQPHWYLSTDWGSNLSSTENSKTHHTKAESPGWLGVLASSWWRFPSSQAVATGFH